ncbi:MAG: HD domain-containing protein, partial [Clostridia bacterium]|nr:HD domain-containing protein [Clostridia bacterium]
MKFPIPVNLTALAQECAFPLYLVGGSVRDFFAGFPRKEITDWDICAPAPEEELTAAAERCGFTVKSVYRNTGTVKLCDQTGIGYEFTRFRSDKYVRGLHVPDEIEFTDDIHTDARRRDFCANAIYYEIKTGKLTDPLDGLSDLKHKILRTVAPADKVFGEDGLRLMRLARFAAETGFLPDEECGAGARRHRALIKDIAPERVFAELSAILHADEKHGDPEAPYRGLCVLRDTGVLGEILPELAQGGGLAQPPEFHAYDVLEHSLRCVRYAPPDIRFAALLHDVGKPFCFLRAGNFHRHETEGSMIAKKILTRLKAPAKLTEET